MPTQEEILDVLKDVWLQFCVETSNVAWPYTAGGLSTLEDVADILIRAGWLERRPYPYSGMYRLKRESGDE